MPIVAGAGVSYSPLLYRSRAAWPSVAAYLRGDSIQPAAAAEEDASTLDGYADRVEAGFEAVKRSVVAAGLDAVILLSADRQSQFDLAHVPQIHLQSGGGLYGDPAIPALGEPPRRVDLACEGPVAALLQEELVRAGFDLAEGRDAFVPVGNPVQGLTPAAIEAAHRVAPGLPVIPLSVNCHVAPLIGGGRLHRLGETLARAADLTAKRLGLLVSGGLSGDPGGRMSGWVDQVFDRWALARIERGRSADLRAVWDVPSRNMLAGTAEVRLWMTAAAALEGAGCRALVHDYMPIYHAAAGVAFVSWEG